VALVRWYDHGDPAAFTEAVRLFGALWPRAFARVDDGDAEDAVQAFLVSKLLNRNARSLLPRDPSVPLLAHVGRVLRNAETSHWRARRPRRYVTLSPDLPAAADVHRVTAAREALGVFRGALSALPVRQRMAYVLHERLYSHGVDVERDVPILAAVLNEPEPAVRGRVSRAVDSGTERDAILVLYPLHGQPADMADTFERTARRGRRAVHQTLEAAGVTAA
jgi:DNA-directed RNA polymerase specialized sigma24 family protein